MLNLFPNFKCKIFFLYSENFSSWRIFDSNGNSIFSEFPKGKNFVLEDIISFYLYADELENNRKYIGVLCSLFLEKQF